MKRTLLASLVLNCGLLLEGAAAIEQPPDCSIILHENKRATVRGVVRENEHACAHDGPCSLHLLCRRTGLELVVSYGPGEAQAKFINQRAINLAWEVQAGDTIEAHGIYRKRNIEKKEWIAVDIWSEKLATIRIVSRKRDK